MRRFPKHTVLLCALPLLAISACKTGKPDVRAAVTEYRFRVQVREKYCHAAHMDPTLIKETEREKPYVSQKLFFLKKGGTDTLSVSTDAQGGCSVKLGAGTYAVYFPEKITGSRVNNTQRCRDWQASADTTLVLGPSQTEVPLNLFRTCSPCQPIRQ